MHETLIILKKINKIALLIVKLLFFYLKNDLSKEEQNLRFWYILTFSIGILSCFFCNPDYQAIYILLCILFIFLSYFYNYIFSKKNVTTKFLMFFLFGFIVAFVNYTKINKNNFNKPEFNIIIDGKIEQIKLTSHENILFLKVIKTPNTELYNKKIRIKYNPLLLQKQSLKNGDIVRIKTSLIPIKYSVFPQDTSYENYAKFSNIIAAGNAKDIKIIKQETKNSIFNKLNMQDFRNKVQKRIFNVNKQSAGAGIVIAILTGNNSFIPKEQLSNIRHSGCAHILAISGLHMSIVVAFIFTIFIHFFALFPKISLNYNTKKIAIIPAVIACLFYLYIANVPISATRSFLMVLINAIAILLNRSNITINALFITFFSMLTLTPSYLLSPSFQMSFMAVFGLVTIYNIKINIENFNPKKIISSYIFGMILSSVAATISTVFFEIYHFKQYAWIGLISNIPVIPIAEFLVLPFGFLGVLFNNTFIGDLFYTISGFFANIICNITEWTASLPYSFLSTKQMTNCQLTIIIFSIIVLFLSHAKILKIISIIMFSIGIMLYVKNPQYILIYDENLKNIVFFEDGKFYSVGKIKNDYIYNIWSQNLGSNIQEMTKNNKNMHCTEERKNKNISCDYLFNGIKIHLKQNKNNRIIGVKMKNNKLIYVS